MLVEEGFLLIPLWTTAGLMIATALVSQIARLNGLLFIQAFFIFMSKYRKIFHFTGKPIMSSLLIERESLLLFEVNLPS